MTHTWRLRFLIIKGYTHRALLNVVFSWMQHLFPEWLIALR